MNYRYQDLVTPPPLACHVKIANLNNQYYAEKTAAFPFAAAALRGIGSMFGRSAARTVANGARSLLGKAKRPSLNVPKANMPPTGTNTSNIVAGDGNESTMNKLFNTGMGAMNVIGFGQSVMSMANTSKQEATGEGNDSPSTISRKRMPNVKYASLPSEEIWFPFGRGGAPPPTPPPPPPPPKPKKTIKERMYDTGRSVGLSNKQMKQIGKTWVKGRDAFLGLPIISTAVDLGKTVVEHPITKFVGRNGGNIMTWGTIAADGLNKSLEYQDLAMSNGRYMRSYANDINTIYRMNR